MPVDVERLRRDAAALGGSRNKDARSSGAMALVRAHLAEIERLRAEGITWTDIAAALAAQGVRRRDGGPISGRRLTALIDSIRRQDAKRQKAMARRISRGDLVPAPSARSSPAPQPLRPSGHPPAEPTTPTPQHRTAEQMRRERLDGFYDMLDGKES
ncbi:hypothetical protein [Lichenibacterium ramalinae]|uniref:Uncharacterized protein n=1 Tax=Lichenibacterium ramalinae TaxID=2316527 RepID=A0A4Q2RGH6_9HYPH|nr:hypothetical protein [Lichenibacterium ramalinae]RYB06601.1 hypothetical protein D3272_04500 [Lichenibacterium ramalinae]